MMLGKRARNALDMMDDFIKEVMKETSLHPHELPLNTASMHVA